jgi:PhnB protein
MASRLNPYLTFDGNARQAMEFYREVLGGNLTVNTFGDFGTPEPAIADKVMHARLESDLGYTLMASDTAPGMDYRPGNNVTVSISGNDAETLRGYWEKLSAGATVTMPMEKQMWGDEYGACVDKFGISWMVDIGEAASA